ncbi:MAG: YgfZ/GcvT domain-containing protein [Leptolyngbyaceae cyanobacterium]
MDNSLHTVQAAMGAVFSPDSEVPITFGDEETALAAAQTGVAICDRSHWGRIRVSDSDHLRFLHNQTTNQIQLLTSGQGCNTIFVTSTGRTLDLVTACVEPDAVLLLTSPGQAESLMAWMDRYIFFADKVKLENETDKTAALTLIGPDSDRILHELGVATASDMEFASHQRVEVGRQLCYLVKDTGLGLSGFTLIVAKAASGALWQLLTRLGAVVPMGERGWQALRIQRGRPMPGYELTEDYNPLESGLWRAVSFDKGCYIGQETIARLQTYQGVKQQLWGLRLAKKVPSGTPIMQRDSKIGVVTSCIETADAILGLGYIRTKAGGAGLEVAIGNFPAKVVDIPFVSRGYLDAH